MDEEEWLAFEVEKDSEPAPTVPLTGVQTLPTISVTATRDVEGYNNMIGNSSLRESEYEKEQTYQAIPGTIVRTLLEFPNFDGNDKSKVIVLDDAMSISYSVYRAKPSVTLLGSNSISGYGLGTRTVAGSIIRSVFTTDNITEFQNLCYNMNIEQIGRRLTGLDASLPSGLPKEDLISFMKDDITSFNIHMCAISEEVRSFENKSNTPFMRFESIIGAIILNNGQVYSIQDLVTESTFSFQAKAVKTATNMEDFSRGFSTNKTHKSISDLLNRR